MHTLASKKTTQNLNNERITWKMPEEIFALSKDLNFNLLINIINAYNVLSENKKKNMKNR